MKAPQPHPRRWSIAAAVLLGTWTGTSLNSMMPVALPSILDEFEVEVDLGVWVISSYVLLAAVFMPASGWLGDRFGFRRVYIAGFLALSGTVVAAALARSYGGLVAARGLQGAFDSVGLPSALAIIGLAFAGGELGLATGIWAAVNGAAHALGPAISGALVGRWGWAAPFWLSGVTALLTVLLLFLLVPADRGRERRPFDVVGMAAFAIGVLSLMLTLIVREGVRVGVRSGLWLLFAFCLIVFTRNQRRAVEPFLPLSLFSNRRFSLITGVAVSQFAVFLGLPFLMSLVLIERRGLETAAAGLLILPLAAVVAIVSPLAGRATDRIGLRASLVLGMAITCAALLGTTLFTDQSPTWLLAATLAVAGLGMGFVHSQGASGATRVVRALEVGIALGVSNMLRFVGGSFGVAGLGLILGSSAADPYRAAFYALLAVAVLGLLLAALLPKTDPIAQIGRAA